LGVVPCQSEVEDAFFGFELLIFRANLAIVEDGVLAAKILRLVLIKWVSWFFGDWLSIV
jgi:hypothetical protein